MIKDTHLPEQTRKDI